LYLFGTRFWSQPGLRLLWLRFFLIFLALPAEFQKSVSVRPWSLHSSYHSKLSNLDPESLKIRITHKEVENIRKLRYARKRFRM
jgi:hypothetical protein